MAQRVSGYRYKRLSNGRKVRVYAGGRRVATGRRAKGYRATRRASTPRGGWMGDTVMGYGAYRLKSGRNIGVARTGGPPVVRNSKSGGFIVRHREYITDVAANTGFTIGAFPLNPGIATTFPWLSQVAQQFEEWVPRGIIFEFKSLSSDAVVSTNANASLGAIVMATEYNPYGTPFGSKQEMENYEWAVSCKPSCNLVHQVECAKSQNVVGEYFVRNAPVPTGQDQRLYDLGIMYAATQGMQSAGNSIGELWISYEIEFRKPRMNADLDVLFDHFSIATATNGNISPGLPFGNNTAVLKGTSTSSLGGTITCANPAKYTFPTGQIQNSSVSVAIGDVFLVTHSQLFVTGGATGTYTIGNLTGCTVAPLALQGGTANLDQQIDVTTATARTISAMWTITITALAAQTPPSFTVQSNGGMVGGPTTAGDFFVISMPNNLN